LQRHAVPLEQRGIDVDGDLAERGGRPPQAIITVEVLFDWFRRRGSGRPPEGASAARWTVHLDGGEVVAEDGRGAIYRAAITGARGVRIVPLTAGNHHVQSSGWQVALARSDGDLLLGKPLPDWQSARELARQVCEQTQLPLDELTERMFSRVGQYPR
jgi:hypothetical protein